MLRCKGSSHHHQKTHDHDDDQYDDQEGKSVDRIVLSEAATGGISGSKLSPDEDELEVVSVIMITMITMMMMARVARMKMIVMMAMTLLQVRIDYKGQRFVGENGKEISGLLVSIFSLFVAESLELNLVWWNMVVRILHCIYSCIVLW